jgi:hypothetical protein
MRRRLNLRKERLAELSPDDLVSVAGGMRDPRQTALSCGIVACTYTVQAACLTQKLSINCPSYTGWCPPPQ